MYENHSRSPISNLNSRRIGWRARKKKVRPDETFSQSTKSIRCDMTQVTWKSPSTYYPHPVEAHARPTLPPLALLPKVYYWRGAPRQRAAPLTNVLKEGSWNKNQYLCPKLGKKRVRRISRLSFCVQRACAV